MDSLWRRTERQRAKRLHRVTSRQWLFGVAAVLAVSTAISACGGGVGGSNSDSNALKPTSTSAEASSTNTTAAAVLGAYRASWTAFEDAAATANPEDPALAASMIDPELQSVKANLLADQMHGIVGRGSTTLHPKIVSLSTNSASVVDCVYSTAELVYQSTGKPVPPVTPPENDGVTATLTRSDGTWKVSKQTVTDGKCAARS